MKINKEFEAQMFSSIKKIMRQNKISREDLAEHLTRRLGRRYSVSMVSHFFKISRPEINPSYSELIVMFERVGTGFVTDNDAFFINQYRKAIEAIKQIETSRR